MRILACQFNYKIGDFQNNTKKILNAIRAHGNALDLIIFSELCVSGYYPWDLINNRNFIQEQDKYLNIIKDSTKNISAAVLVGYIDKNTTPGKPYCNALGIFKSGIEIFKYHKQLLATYDVFDEDRHFERGELANIFQYEQQKIGILICEDGWNNLDGRNNLEQRHYKVNPVENLKHQALNFIICINASPGNVGKQAQRIAHFSKVATDCNCPVIYISQVGGNDGIVFDGSSFVIDKTGRVCASLKHCSEDQGQIVIQNLNIQLISGFTKYQPITDAAVFYKQILLGLSDYVAKNNIASTVVGISGGIDSALTLALAVKALGCAKVTAINMPSQYSSADGISDAENFAKVLGVKFYCIPIDQEYLLALEQFTRGFVIQPTSLVAQNIQSRIRCRILMSYANQTGSIVIATSNKSELATGFGTLYGDMAGGISVLGDLYKGEVYDLAKYYNNLHRKQPISQTIIDREPSAELTANQKDTDLLPKYEILDAFLRLYLEGDLLTKDAIAHCKSRLKNVTANAIRNMQLMVDSNEFKRKQFPTIIKLHARAFGCGRLNPITASINYAPYN